METMIQEDDMKKFSGEWILVFNDKIVDHSVNIEDILKIVDEKYPSEKFTEDSIKISRVMEQSPRNIIIG